MFSHWRKSNLASRRGHTWVSASWWKRKDTLPVVPQKRLFSPVLKLCNPGPEFRAGKDTKHSSFHLQKHGWWRAYHERLGYRMARRDGGHIRTREDFRFCLPNLLWSAASLILALANLWRLRRGGVTWWGKMWQETSIGGRIWRWTKTPAPSSWAVWPDHAH